MEAAPAGRARIVVKKGERRLTFIVDGKTVRTFRVGLGCAPLGGKQQEGDGRTPEGAFVVCTKNPRSKFTLSLGLSYPNREAARRGLRDGLITREQHDAIVAALEAGRRPPWDTPLGGEIFIHGHGASTDWTRGCIALDDDDIRWLYPRVSTQTPVEIMP